MVCLDAVRATIFPVWRRRLWRRKSSRRSRSSTARGPRRTKSPTTCVFLLLLWFPDRCANCLLRGAQYELFGSLGLPPPIRLDAVKTYKEASLTLSLAFVGARNIVVLVELVSGDQGLQGGQAVVRQDADLLSAGRLRLGPHPSRPGSHSNAPLLVLRTFGLSTCSGCSTTCNVVSY